MSLLEVSQLTCSQGSQLTYSHGSQLACSEQCGFFQWADEQYPTGHKHVDEMNELRLELMRQRDKYNLKLEEFEDERVAWNRKEAEIMSQLSSVRAELDQMKKRLMKVDDPEPLPFYENKLSGSDNMEEDDAKVIQEVESP
ncbi:OLC1v1002983C1 [Oldenlandia corymbosa var. corymbosa]|uniref:OLC1v1002983C1 n=1 Tax=Oldenlandia corymbosa var. corymbosa TaxID=529605 RepID=A0AAV1D906_OLDCO|nr:OLC1v1002983C1 [Oldenlandia corymbosa var. corymbosa]